jgi:hypothetical protein
VASREDPPIESAEIADKGISNVAAYLRVPFAETLVNALMFVRDHGFTSGGFMGMSVLSREGRAEIQSADTSTPRSASSAIT